MVDVPSRCRVSFNQALKLTSGHLQSSREMDAGCLFCRYR